MKEWKCDTCKHQLFISEEYFMDLVCTEGHWNGGRVSDEYKENNTDPWKNCKNYEVTSMTYNPAIYKPNRKSETPPK
jgi:hypothetical protein